MLRIFRIQQGFLTYSIYITVGEYKAKERTWLNTTLFLIESPGRPLLESTTLEETLWKYRVRQDGAQTKRPETKRPETKRPWTKRP
jgi:hypothetical protein